MRVRIKREKAENLSLKFSCRKELMKIQWDYGSSVWEMFSLTRSKREQTSDLEKDLVTKQALLKDILVVFPMIINLHSSETHFLTISRPFIAHCSLLTMLLRHRYSYKKYIGQWFPSSHGMTNAASHGLILLTWCEKLMNFIECQFSPQYHPIVFRSTTSQLSATTHPIWTNPTYPTQIPI